MAKVNKKEDYQSDISKLWDKKERLNPELKNYLVKDVLGQSIKHPLLYDILYLPKRNAEFNYRLKFKKAKLEKALADKKYLHYILLHERAYRLLGIYELMDMPEIPRKEIAKTILWCWSDSENIWENLNDWKKLLKRFKKELRDCMSEEDKKVFDKLPDTLIVYRGCFKKNEKGISWTTSKSKAKYFANRFSKFSGEVIEKEIKKESIVFFTDQRGEKEVVLLR